MKIKVGRHEFNVTDKDYVLDNGACYQLITQKFVVNSLDWWNAPYSVKENRYGK